MNRINKQEALVTLFPNHSCHLLLGTKDTDSSISPRLRQRHWIPRNRKMSRPALVSRDLPPNSLQIQTKRMVTGDWAADGLSWWVDPGTKQQRNPPRGHEVLD